MLKHPDTIKWHFGTGAAVVLSTVNCLQWHKQGLSWVLARDLCNRHRPFPAHDLGEVCFLEVSRKLITQKQQKQPEWRLGIHVRKCQFLKNLIDNFYYLVGNLCGYPRTSLLGAWLRSLKDLNFRDPQNDSWRLLSCSVAIAHLVCCPMHATTTKGLHKRWKIAASNLEREGGKNASR